MKVLLVNDDRWHPGKVSDEGVKPLEKKGFHIDTLNDGADFAGRELSEYPVVMFVKGNNRTASDETNWMTEETREKLKKYVQGGGGLLVMHSGTTGYNGMEDLHSLFGGLFMTHPKGLPVTFSPIAGHPITKGVEAFTETEEHYFMDIADEPLNVFLTGSTRHGTLPAGWTREDGQGRVCALTPGHNVALWLNPNFQKLLENALNWCARKL